MGNPKSKAEGGEGTNVGKFLRGIKGVAPDILNLAGSITGFSALNKLGDAIRGSDSITPEDKEVALKMLEMDAVEYDNVTKRWQSDNLTDSWMSKNIRPLTLGFLTLSLTVYVVLDSSLTGFKIKNEWIDLLSSLLLLVYAAYFGMRGMEKIQKIRNKK